MGGQSNPRGQAGVPKASTAIQSVETNQIMHLVSAGPCVGLANTTSPAQSVYFNGTPVQNADNTFNYPGVFIDQRTGTASQTAIPGFTNVSADFNVNVNVPNGTPVVRTTSSGLVDAVNVTINFPMGLSKTDQKSGAVNPSSVQFNIWRRAPSSSGVWELAVAGDTITGKGDQGYEQTYYIRRPTTAGAWDVKVERLTVIAPDQYTQDASWFKTLTEIQDVNQTYNGSGYVALKYDAKSAPDAVPQLFDWIGMLVKVPSNYNPVTRVYTGTWNGTLSGTLQWTDNPAWILYDLLTRNDGTGLGDRITPAMVDLASFYAAAKYNDELVPDGKGGTEPRFRFNAQLSTQDDSWKMVQNLAGTFNAALFIGSGLVTLVQDRPVTSFTLVTKADVSEEGFSYSSSARSARHTSVAMSFTDESDSSNVRVILEPQTGDAIYGPFQSRYGYQHEQLAAWGCTSEGQARRAARWVLDTELFSTDIISYKAPLSHFNVNPGSVIKVMDNDWANSIESGKVISVVGTTVTLDRPVVISGGTVLIDVLLADGTTVEQKTITTSPGTASTVTVASAFSQAVTPGASFIVSGSISPRYFRVINIAESDDGFYQVTALFYDPAKYARVENGTVVPAVIYSDTSASSIPAAPWGLQFDITGSLVSETAVRGLLVDWQAPKTGAASYTLQYRLRGAPFTVVQDIYTTSYELKNILPGTYDVSVQAVSRYGVASAPLNGVYTVSLDGGVQPMTIVPVTGVQVVGGGTSFGGQDLFFEWTNPASNAGKNPALKDFIVNIYTTGGVLLRTFNVDPVAAGNKGTASYSYGANLADGGPRRSVRVDVIARDVLNNVTSATSATLTNAAPAVPGSIAVVGGLQSNTVKYTLPTDSDFKGILVWRSTTSGFTPALGNLIYDGSDSAVTDSALADVTTYYYKVAAYDQFGKDLAGTGLNVSAQYSATTSAAPGINKGASLPGSAVEGDIFLNTTDGKLYRYHSGAWTAAIPSTDITGSITDAQIAGMAASKVTGTLTNAQLAAIDAAKITGQIVGTQITDNSITTAKIGAGQVTANQIAGNTITANEIAANAITSSELAAGAVVAGKIAAGTIVANDIAAGAVTAGKLLITGQGKALNDDPACMDLSAWNNPQANISIVTNVSQPAGSYAIRMTGAGQVYSRAFPIEGGKKYKVTAWARQVSGTGIFYLRQYNYNAADALQNYTVYSDALASTIEGVAVPGSWTRYVGYITPNAGCVWAYLYIHANWTGTGTTDLCDLRVEEYIGADLIVDGSIAAKHIAASTITGDKIVGGTITAANIAGNTITAAQISASAGITAGQIDARGLSIKDASGNVILSAGTPLTSSYITPSGTWLNSNITVDGSGVLSGIGTGSVVVDNTKQQWNQVQSKPGSDAQLVRNYIDSNVWVLGSSAAPSGWSQNPASAGGSNSIAMDLAPDGISRPVWKGISGSAAGTSSEGGIAGTPTFVADATKSYRMSVWIKNEVNTNGSTYFGVSGANVAPLGSTTSDGNPYNLIISRVGLVPGRWYLYVGYVFAHGCGLPAVTQATSASAIYDGVTGLRVSNGGTGDFQFQSTTTDNLGLRTFNYYTNGAGQIGKWWGPRIELMDGTEPTVQQLLAPAIASVTQNTNTVTLVNATPTTLSVVGTTAEKTAGGSAWGAASVYSKDSYTGGAYVSFVPSVLGHFVIGLNTDPTTNNDQSSIDYGFHCTSGGVVYYLNSGSAGSIGTYAAGDVCAVTYDGTNIRYLKNGTVLHTIAVTITAPLFLDSDFYMQGSKVTNIQFGPMSSNAWGDVGSKPANVAALSGGENIQNGQITISSGAIWGIGSGGGTQVENALINVSGGTINGIGTGNGTAVANSLMSVSSPSAGVVQLNGGSGGSVSGIVMPSNPITSGNASTYIASAAIGSAQIGSVDAGTITTGYLAAGRLAAGTITAASGIVGSLSANVITTGVIAATNAVVTGTIIADGVNIVRIASNNTSTGSQTGVFGIGGPGTYYYLSLGGTPSYTTYCYGNRKIDFVGYSCTTFYTHIAGPSGTMSFQPVVRRYVDGVGTEIWSGNTYTGTGQAISLTGSATILDNTSLGTLGTAHTVLYAMELKIWNSVSGETCTVGGSMGTLPYPGQRYVCVTEYQR